MNSKAIKYKQIKWHNKSINYMCRFSNLLCRIKTWNNLSMYKIRILKKYQNKLYYSITKLKTINKGKRNKRHKLTN